MWRERIGYIGGEEEGGYIGGEGGGLTKLTIDGWRS